MKTILSVAALLLFPLLTHASQPIEVRADFRTIDREDRLRNPRKLVERRTESLQITVRNTSGKPFPEGEVDWAILVDRGGMRKPALDTGKEKLPALGTGQSVTFLVGAVEIVKTPQGKHDTDYRVIIRHGAVESARISSDKNFDQIAKWLEKPGGKRPDKD